MFVRVGGSSVGCIGMALREVQIVVREFGP